MEASQQIPPMGSPEFRAFVQTPEWMAMRHSQALEDDKAWEAQRKYDQLHDISPIYMLGASAIPVDSKVWSRDWRERLPVDNALRMDYEESIYGASETQLIAGDVINLRALHEAILATTEVALDGTIRIKPAF